MARSLLFIALFAWLAALAAPIRGGEKGSETQKSPAAQIVAGKVEHVWDDQGGHLRFTETGPANLAIKRVNLIAEAGGRFTVQLYTENFDKEAGNKLRVRVGERLLTPHSWGGDKDVYWFLELREVDAATAQVLNGGPISGGPKESIKVEFRPFKDSYAAGEPVKVGITLTNVGQVPLTIFWGTHGGGNYPCRDTHLSFKATLDGAPAAANPKPLPDGFISSPFALKTKSYLRRSEDLGQWIDFQKPGKYGIEVSYLIEIMNPTKDATPSQWKVTYSDRFSVQIGK